MNDPVRTESATSRRLGVLGGLLLACALSAWIGLALSDDPAAHRDSIAEINTALILIIYGPLGLAGDWLARRAGCPGILPRSPAWSRSLLISFAAGLALGAVLFFIEMDLLAFGGLPRLPHPVFRGSFAAAISVIIGREIVFRAFVLGLFAAALQPLLARRGWGWAAPWSANALAAVIYAGATLRAALMTPAGTDILIPLAGSSLIEALVLNGLLGLAAGERFVKQGLTAAISLHLGATIAWHFIFPLLFHG